MVDVSRILRAVEFATEAHSGQYRKYGPAEDYLCHVLRVARTVADNGADEDTIVAALLHDTIEDTWVEHPDIEERFGSHVAALVLALTDYDHRDYGRTHEFANRMQRKVADAARLEGAPAQVQTIKCADIIDNTRSIVDHDPNFAVQYLKEIKFLLAHLRNANADLHREATQIVRDADLKLQIMASDVFTGPTA